MGLLNAIYRHLPLVCRRLLDPIANCYRWLRCLRVDLWSASGIERHSQLPMSVLLGIPAAEKTYLLGLMFGTSFQQASLGRVWSWNMSKVAQAASVDHSLLVVRVEKPQYRAKVKRGFLVIPNWVSGEINLPLDSKVMRSHAVVSDLKKIRDHKLEFDITRESSQFEKFYREMHIPYMTKVYGDAAFVIPYENLKDEFRTCELLLVKKDGEYISGMIIALSPTGIRLWLLGVRNGDRTILR